MELAPGSTTRHLLDAGYKGQGGGVGASLVTQTAKNLPVMQETQFRSLDWEDPLEKGMATHSSILTWRIPRT